MNSNTKGATSTVKKTKRRNKNNLNDIKKEHYKGKYPNVESFSYVNNKYNVEEVSAFTIEEDDEVMINKTIGNISSNSNGNKAKGFVTKDTLTLAIQSIHI